MGTRGEPVGVATQRGLVLFMMKPPSPADRGEDFSVQSRLVQMSGPQSGAAPRGLTVMEEKQTP